MYFSPLFPLAHSSYVTTGLGWAENGVWGGWVVGQHGGGWIVWWVWEPPNGGGQTKTCNAHAWSTIQGYIYEVFHCCTSFILHWFSYLLFAVFYYLSWTSQFLLRNVIRIWMSIKRFTSSIFLMICSSIFIVISFIVPFLYYSYSLKLFAKLSFNFNYILV